MGDQPSCFAGGRTARALQLACAFLAMAVVLQYTAGFWQALLRVL
jgi:hypothetical protein